MKLSHYLQLGMGLAIVVITWVLQQTAAGNLTLPAIAITLLTVAKTAIGLLSDSVPTALAAKRARLAALKLTSVLVLGALMLACSSCTNGQPSPAVVPSVNLAVCIFDQYATAPACRPNGNWVSCVTGIANACGADAASVEQVLAAQRKAMVADGYVVPPLPDGGP